MIISYEVSSDLAFPTWIASVFSNHYFLLPAPFRLQFLARVSPLLPLSIRICGWNLLHL